jgi:NAD+ kinase
MGMPTTAVYIGSFDPPIRHHRRVVELLAAKYESVVVIPSGPNNSRSRQPSSAAVHRATMADLNFRGIKQVRIDLSDLEKNRFTPHHEVEKRFSLSQSEPISFVVSSEFVRRNEQGKSFIQKEWQEGEKLWNNSHFTIIKESKEVISTSELPQQHTIINVDAHLRSESIRLMLMNDEACDHYLDPYVAAYIHRRGLYHDASQQRQSFFKLTQPKLSFFVDERNESARKLAAELKPFDSTEPETIVSVGGDGTMLRAIRSRWRERIPFFGLNAGGQGFLLNGRQAHEFWKHELMLYHLPLLHMLTELRDGKTVESLAFNDAWVERATGQTAWLKVTINGDVRVPKLVGDGLLVATAAGSSSYARAMGATPVPLNTDVLVLAGSNVYLPTFWKPALLPTDSVIEIETLDPDRRPLRGAIDGYEIEGAVRKMTVRVSRTAAAEVAFLPEHDPVAKLAFMQFSKA